MHILVSYPHKYFKNICWQDKRSEGYGKLTIRFQVCQQLSGNQEIASNILVGNCRKPLLLVTAGCCAGLVDSTGNARGYCKTSYWPKLQSLPVAAGGEITALSSCLPNLYKCSPVVESKPKTCGQRILESVFRLQPYHMERTSKEARIMQV